MFWFGEGVFYLRDAISKVMLLTMADATIDPPDSDTPDCSWCSVDARTTAFCCAQCEAESNAANEEPSSDDEGYYAATHDLNLAFLFARGL